MRIAVLHDDPLLPDMIRGALERHHHVCHFYASGASLLKDTRHETFDLLISGWHLPDMDGIEVIQRLREMAGQQLPILRVTRRNEERDVIEALNRGADDYMVKPLRVGELVARVAALLRRAYPQAMGQQLVFGPYPFDPEKRQLTFVRASDPDMRQVLASLNWTHLDRNGTFWIGTSGYGLIKYDPRKNRALRCTACLSAVSRHRWRENCVAQLHNADGNRTLPAIKGVSQWGKAWPDG